MVSIGEDATYQYWDLQEGSSVSNELGAGILTHLETFSNHAGKNIWSYGLSSSTNEEATKLVTGGADGTVAVSELQCRKNDTSGPFARHEWQFETIKTILHGNEPPLAHLPPVALGIELPEYREDGAAAGKSKKKSSIPKAPKNTFKTYDLLDSHTLLLATQQGEILVGTMNSEHSLVEPDISTDSSPDVRWHLLERYESLVGYSVLKCLEDCGLAFFTGTDGIVYSYHHDSSTLSEVCRVEGRVANLFVQKVDCSTKHDRPTYEMFMLVTRLGTCSAHVFRFKYTIGGALDRSYEEIEVEMVAESVSTTALFVNEADHNLVLFVGSREGTVARFSHEPPQYSPREQGFFKLDQQWICHSDTVTSLHWISGETEGGYGHLITTGRDSVYTITRINTAQNHRELVHQLALPFGPYIEGLDIRQSDQHLILHGFRSKYFVVYDETAQRELMRVDCGGSHRSWAFRLSHDSGDPSIGTLVWTKASKLCKYSMPSRTQRTIKPGGHGREIKACAVNPRVRTGCEQGAHVVATGAEDTDIRLFSYKQEGCDGYPELKCLAIVRKHNTGLQGLQWSTNGRYLFSSAGCEEFYVWKVGVAPFAGIGMVCLGAMPTDTLAGQVPEQRIMSFEAVDLHSDDEGTEQFLIALVLSDSSLRVSFARMIPQPFASNISRYTVFPARMTN